MVNLQIGAAYRNLKDYDKAIAAYNDPAEGRAGKPRRDLGVALANMDKGDVQAAERMLTRAAAAPLSSRDVFYNLAEIKMREEPDRRSDRLVSEGGRCRHVVGQAALQAGNDRDEQGRQGQAALKAMTQVMAVDPTSPEAAQAKTALEQLK